jgi:hypothetical protein
MHPYEVEIYVRHRQRELQLEIERLKGVYSPPAFQPGWLDRLLWGAGRMLIRCGRRLCRASGIPLSTPGRRRAADLQAP